MNLVIKFNQSGIIYSKENNTINFKTTLSISQQDIHYIRVGLYNRPLKVFSYT